MGKDVANFQTRQTAKWVQVPAVFFQELIDMSMTETSFYLKRLLFLMAGRNKLDAAQI